MSTKEYLSLHETLVLLLFFFILFVGLLFNFKRQALYWQY